MRTVALFTHERRSDVQETAREVRRQLTEAGIDVVGEEHPDPCVGAELALVIGGDGTILHAAEHALAHSVPILGINFGHVGFLAEAEPSSLPDVIDRIIAHEWTVDSRMTIDVSIAQPSGAIIRSWALNEAAIIKTDDARMLEADIGVDGRAVSSFTADTVLFSTPTGSTAYNFSAGGPVVWPDVDAMIFTPIAAHALFTRPLVVGPSSTLSARIGEEPALVWLDGRRTYEAEPGADIEVVKGEKPVLLARLENTPFSGRLVKKFQLPTHGWRGKGGDR